jgi:hypothetical protein
LLDPAKPDDVCDKCTDDRKDKPMLGMTIAQGVKKTPTTRPCGTAARSSTPTTASLPVRLKPKDGGKELAVRGYIGPFYRNQTWIRVE